MSKNKEIKIDIDFDALDLWINHTSTIRGQLFLFHYLREGFLFEGAKAKIATVAMDNQGYMLFEAKKGVFLRETNINPHAHIKNTMLSDGWGLASEEIYDEAREEADNPLLYPTFNVVGFFNKACGADRPNMHRMLSHMSTDFEHAITGDAIRQLIHHNALLEIENGALEKYKVKGRGKGGGYAFDAFDVAKASTDRSFDMVEIAMKGEG